VILPRTMSFLREEGRLADDRQHDRARSPACRRRADRPRGANARGLGRSRGGPSAKIRAATAAPGNPVRLLFGPGRRNDITKAHALIEGLEAEAVIVDKGYDADHGRDAIRDRGAEPVIPPNSNRRAPHLHDKALHEERNLVERFFNKIKQFRRAATRYDKLLANYRGFVPLAAIAIMLR
jgi:putative transposase